MSCSWVGSNIDTPKYYHMSPQFFLHYLQSATQDNCDKMYVKMCNTNIMNTLVPKS